MQANREYKKFNGEIIKIPPFECHVSSPNALQLIHMELDKSVHGKHKNGKPHNLLTASKKIIDEYILKHIGIDRPTRTKKDADGNVTEEAAGFRRSARTRLVNRKGMQCTSSSTPTTASNLCTIFTQYRRIAKQYGKVHPEFERSLTRAKRKLKSLGVPESIIATLKPSLTAETFERRIEVIKKELSETNPEFYIEKRVEIGTALHSIKIYHPFYYDLEPIMKVASDVKSVYMKKRQDERANNPPHANPDALYEKATEILTNYKDYDHIDLCLAIMAVTGRRQVEVLKLASFTLTDYRENYIGFKGIAKAKNRKYKEDLGNFKIPTMCNPALIPPALNSMRRKMSNHEKREGGIKFTCTSSGKNIETRSSDPRYANDLEHNRCVTQMYRKAIAERLAQWLSSHMATSKILRGIYVASVQERESKLAETQPEYSESPDMRASRILCYKKDELSSAASHYTLVNINRRIKMYQHEKKKEPEMKTSETDLMTLLNSMDDVIYNFASQKSKVIVRLHEDVKLLAKGGFTVEQMTSNKIISACRKIGGNYSFCALAMYLMFTGLIEKRIAGQYCAFYLEDGVWYRESLTADLPPKPFWKPEQNQQS